MAPPRLPWLPLASRLLLRACKLSIAGDAALGSCLLLVSGLAPAPPLQTTVAQRPAVVLKSPPLKHTFGDGNEQGHSRVRRLHPLAPPAAQGDRRDARLVQSRAQRPGQR